MLLPLSTTFLCPHIIPYFFLSVIAFQTKAAEGEKGFLGLQLEGMVHHSRGDKEAGVCGSFRKQRDGC